MNPIASKEIQLQRLAVCEKCPSYDVKKDKCKECGCYMAYKVWFNKSTCPLKKWV